ncbi:MAG: iron-containing alcohol dehydrogenase, partial [Bacillota bacterium]|nr:iron-containing alcohol dehydrogenase [Bacillota bacterium]
MDIKGLVDGLKNCPCGRKHEIDIKAVEIGSGLLNKTAEILTANNFPKKILVVADKNTLKASEGILEVLKEGGFLYGIKLYENLREADVKGVNEVEEESKAYEGILSVGSGSLNDICRRAAFLADKEFAIFATAPSMDGFASGTSPITENNFKVTKQARQPSIIIADTKILANAPAELKSAGFGDMIAKYIALVDWKVSHLVTGEYYCENVALITKKALEKVVKLAPRVTEASEEAAEAIMEALVLTGLAMKLADCVRPASGTEHIISHYWEIKKLEKGLISDYHGKKVGVATLFATRIYKNIILNKNIKFTLDKTDWDEVYKAYGPNFSEDIKKLNSPTVTDETTPEILRENWDEIVRIVHSELPSESDLLNLMKQAGAAATLDEISVSKDLGLQGLKYHPYMRHRMTLMRLLPMTDIKIDYEQ